MFILRERERAGVSRPLFSLFEKSGHLAYYTVKASVNKQTPPLDQSASQVEIDERKGRFICP